MIFLYEAFVEWGQHYGLWVSVALLIFILIMMKIENKQLRTNLDKFRSENLELKKINHESEVNK